MDLNFSADGHDSLCDEGLDLIVQGDSGTTDITGITRTGEDDIVTFLLEEGTEDRTSDIAMYTQVGSSSGTGSILSGVTTT